MQSTEQDRNAWVIATPGQRHGVPQDSALGTTGSRDSRKRKDPPTRDTPVPRGPRQVVVKIPYLRLQESDYTSRPAGKKKVSAKEKGDNDIISSSQGKFPTTQPSEEEAGMPGKEHGNHYLKAFQEQGL